MPTGSSPSAENSPEHRRDKLLPEQIFPFLVEWINNTARTVDVDRQTAALDHLEFPVEAGSPEQVARDRALGSIGARQQVLHELSKLLLGRLPEDT